MTATHSSPRRSIKLLISVLVSIHLLAVFLPPLAFQSRGPLGPSPAVGTLLRPLEGYSQFLYIDRGYAFFAPNPGPSHLIQAAFTRDERTEERLYPDRRRQWPRLLYHRHLMIAAYLQEIYEPPGPPPELSRLDPATAADWTRSRARYERVRQSILDHLRSVHPDDQVAIRRIEHLVPDWVDYRREPIALTDQRLYRVLLDEPLELGSLEGATVDPSLAEELHSPSRSVEPVPLPEAATGAESQSTPQLEPVGEQR
jgi:hypothetical protein